MDEIIIHGPEFSTREQNNVPLPQFIYNTLKAQQNMKKVALIDAITGASYTFGDIDALSARLASSLQDRGVKINDVIAICIENRIEYLVLIVALLYIGAIAAPINPVYTKDELIRSISISRPKFIFASKATLGKVCEVANTVEGIQEVITLDKTADASKKSLITYNDLVSTESTKFKVVSASPEQQTAIILSSSGTTGPPKGVKLSHDNIMCFIKATNDEQYISTTPGIRIMGLLPFFHGYGYGLLLNVIVQELQIIILAKFDEELFLSSIQKYKIQGLPLVPPLMTWIAKTPLTTKYDLSSVIEIICGAAPLAELTARETSKKLNGAKIIHAYGMTEASIVCTLCLPASNKFPSVGKLIPGMSCKVVDLETGKSLGPGKIGELWFKGKYVMQGYCDDPKATSSTIGADGWLHTGDVGYYDQDHYFYIVDRIKELIKYKAYQVAPAELEDILLKHPGIKDVAVVGKPHPRDGEHPTAFVVKQPDAEITADEIISFVADKVSPQKKLRGGIYFVDTIPKNPSGKILRRLLREQLRTKSKL